MKLNQIEIPKARVEMLPLIDVVFLLLVFFIFAMLSMAVHHGQEVDLPESTSATLEIQDSISITIKDTGAGVHLFVDENSVALGELVGVLQALSSGTKDESDVQFFADETVSYQELFTVMDHVKQAGLSKISLQAEHE